MVPRDLGEVFGNASETTLQNVNFQLPTPKPQGKGARPKKVTLRVGSWELEVGS
jgi:hypothetical protein